MQRTRDTSRNGFVRGAFYNAAIEYQRLSKERIYKKILNQKFGIQDIQKSVLFDKWYIAERLKAFYHLEKMLDSNTVTYLINNKRYIQYTSIRADYLCERNIDADILYLFVVREQKSPKFLNECRGCSLFTKHSYTPSETSSPPT
ncbi:MAG: hypothetical protein KHY46_04805 [Clostridiales bacterium]|nr:hypothetical protein [Clostridiales bacterium]